MDALVVVLLVILIPLLLLILLFWLICVCATVNLIRHGDPDSSRSSQVSSLLMFVACDMALPVMGGILTLQIAGAAPSPSGLGSAGWVLLLLSILLCGALVASAIAITLLFRDYFAEARRKAAETGEGLWISRHGDG